MMLMEKLNRIWGWCRAERGKDAASHSAETGFSVTVVHKHHKKRIPKPLKVENVRALLMLERSYDTDR
jgi:hypothetical protein